MRAGVRCKCRPLMEYPMDIITKQEDIIMLLM